MEKVALVGASALVVWMAEEIRISLIKRELEQKETERSYYYKETKTLEAYIRKLETRERSSTNS